VFRRHQNDEGERGVFDPNEAFRLATERQTELRAQARTLAKRRERKVEETLPVMVERPLAQGRRREAA
jgi:hypothetical protein